MKRYFMFFMVFFMTMIVACAEMTKKDFNDLTDKTFYVTKIEFKGYPGIFSNQYKFNNTNFARLMLVKIPYKQIIKIISSELKIKVDHAELDKIDLNKIEVKDARYATAFWESKIKHGNTVEISIDATEWYDKSLNPSLSFQIGEYVYIKTPKGECNPSIYRPSRGTVYSPDPNLQPQAAYQIVEKEITLFPVYLTEVLKQY